MAVKKTTGRGGAAAGRAKAQSAAGNIPHVLAQAVGAYRERAPLGSVRQHFACTWFHEFPLSRATPEAIVPDGCIDLQWIDGALRVAGPDREPVLETIPAGATVVGLRFQPGAATAWLRVSASELVNRRVPLEAFWGTEARGLADWVSEARTPDGVARRLEAALARRGASVGPADAASSTVYRLLSANRHPNGQVVDWLAGQLGLSQRTLRRRCHEAFGYGPKTLDRILRFQRFLRLARAAEPDGAASLAAKAGYADQAHLTRETRRLAGLTPLKIREQLSS